MRFDHCVAVDGLFADLNASLQVLLLLDSDSREVAIITNILNQGRLQSSHRFKDLAEI